MERLNLKPPHKPVQNYYQALKEFESLVEIARIVQAADFKDQLDAHPAARGLELISRGFPSVTKDDHETAERASFLYDALYVSVTESQTNPTSS